MQLPATPRSSLPAERAGPSSGEIHIIRENPPKRTTKENSAEVAVSNPGARARTHTYTHTRARARSSPLSFKGGGCGWHRCDPCRGPCVWIFGAGHRKKTKQNKKREFENRKVAGNNSRQRGSTEETARRFVPESLLLPSSSSSSSFPESSPCRIFVYVYVYS